MLMESRITCKEMKMKGANDTRLDYINNIIVNEMLVNDSE